MKYILALLIIMLLNAHNNYAQKGIQLTPTYSHIFLTPELQTIVEDFFKGNKQNNCFNEMYIDKVLPSKTIVTLRTSQYSTKKTKINNPLFYITIQNKKRIYVYSGIEELLQADRSKNRVNFHNYECDQYKFLEITFEKDKIKIDSSGFFPFFPRTHIEYLPPLEDSIQKR